MNARWREEYQRKLTTPEDAVKIIKPGYTCASAMGAGEPSALLEAMAVREDLTDVRIAQVLAMRKMKYLEPDYSGRFRHISWFTSGASRQAVQEGRGDYVPSFYHEMPMLHRDYWNYDVFFATVSPMDRHGWFSFGTAVSESHAMVSKAERIILEVNQFMPRVHGQSMIHISNVDVLIENDSPLPELISPPPGDEDRKIGMYIAELVEDGATIQLGIGATPNIVAQELCKKRNLGIHTEMFTDGMLDMIEAGAVTNMRKNLHQGKSIATFALGTRKLYDFLDDNLGIEFHPVSYVNNPDTIAAHDKFVSVNSCVEVDLLGQVCAESVGPVHFSGTGGQVDFVRGSSKSVGGKAFITTHSKNKNKSKIVAALMPGAVVTTSKSDVDYVVTEYGTAKLKGKTAGERARAMIAIAHPEFRDELTGEAQKMRLLP